MQYTIGEALKNVIFLLRTKVFFPKARLIRFPFLLRGKEHFDYGSGLTMGYFCRFDLGGKGITLEIGQNVKLNDRVHIVAHRIFSFLTPAMEDFLTQLQIPRSLRIVEV